MSDEPVAKEAPEAEPHDEDNANGDHLEEHEIIEQLGGDALEEVRERPRAPRRQYKIQEVIKRRQILLVQVVKEERGNKGAALTTYLSLAGRYSVLMPNTGRGGGISRKITNAADRKRLKDIAHDLEVPDGMGIILRTAGASRTKAEIKRDYEYLMRLWESVRELTLQSSAPALVYEEGSLIKRAIRDLYNKDIDEVLVSGDDGYREAKDFMRMLMPSHAKIVKPYKEPAPLFAKYGIEAQLDAMFSNQVTLKSGGYLVINPTEALVSIDVNSGRSTREHNIEDTALKTNLEAAEEIARQLRLRDLAGLIVIDFIDMEEKRNNRSVEKKLNECLKSDRARIQVGRISPFGLLEMSRQRIRTGVLEILLGAVSALRRIGLRARHALNCAARPALRRGTAHQERFAQPRRAHPPRTRFLHPEPEARAPARARDALCRLGGHRRGRGPDRHHDLRNRQGRPCPADRDQGPGDQRQRPDRRDRSRRRSRGGRAGGRAGDRGSRRGRWRRGARRGDRADGQGDGRRRRRRRRRRGRGDREYTNGGSEAAGEGDAEEGEDLPVLAHAEDVAAEPPVAVAESADGDEEDRAGRRRRRGRRGGRGRGRDEFSHDSGDDSAPAMAAAGEADRPRRRSRPRHPRTRSASMLRRSLKPLRLQRSPLRR